jgi:glycine cleavage system aminomethyltransferase T
MHSERSDNGMWGWGRKWRTMFNPLTAQCNFIVKERRKRGRRRKMRRRRKRRRRRERENE